MRSKYINNLTSAIFDKIKFDEEIIEIAYEASREKSLKNENYADDSKSNLEKQLGFVRQKKNKLLDTYLSDLIEQSVYEAKMKELENDKIVLENQFKTINGKNINSLATLEQIKKVFLTASRAKKTFLKYNDNKKRELLEILLWNFTIENKKIADFRFKMPYELLANTPKNCDLETMLGDRDSNPN